MNRLTYTFRARIQPSNWILIALLLVATIFFMWQGSGVLCLFPLLLLLLVIERTIHTEYRLSHESLIVTHGRLSRDIVIPVSSIERVEMIRRLRIGKKALITYLLVVCEGERSFAVIPQNEDEFISRLSIIRKAHEA